MSSLLLKPQIPSFTVPQLSEAMDVLLERAHELKVIIFLSQSHGMNHFKRFIIILFFLFKCLPFFSYIFLFHDLSKKKKKTCCFMFVTFMGKHINNGFTIYQITMDSLIKKKTIYQITNLFC